MLLRCESLEQPMSQMGHFQPRQRRLASGLMSAAGLIAAVRSTDAGSPVSANSGRERMQQIASSFDHLVGAQLERPRYIKSEYLRCFEIDHQLKFRRCLHGKLA